MGFIKSLLMGIVGRYVQTAVDVIKVEIAIAAIKAIDGARKIFMLLSLWIFLLTLVAVGLAMIPVALCVFLPWSPTTKLIVSLVFAFLYIVVPTIVLSTLMSQRRWMSIFHANELVEKVLRKK